MKVNYTTSHNRSTPSYRKTITVAALFVASMVLITTPAQTAEFAGELKSVQIVDAGSSNLAPNAVIEYSKDASNVYTFSAAKSSDPDGSISEYRWDFGDGNTAEGMTATHQYAGDPTPVTLTVVDNLGGVALGQTVVNAYTEPFELIVDDADTKFSTIGSWNSNNALPGFYGSGYKATPSGNGDEKAFWSFDLPTAGNYQVYVQYATNDYRASDAPYTVQIGENNLGEKRVDQRINGGKFNSIGSFFMEKGLLTVSLRSTSSGYVCADAVKVVYIP